MRGQKINKTCGVCGVMFTDYVSNKRSTFCSLSCYWESKNGGIGFWKGKKRLHMTGEKNWKWKGDKVTYVSLHQWVKRTLGTPNTCEMCGFESGSNYKIQWANVSGKYQRVTSDWIRLCVPCHRKYDGWTKK